MPSYRVAGSTISLGIFDIVGQDGKEFGFIGHVGLAGSAGTQNAAEIPVLDMAPPLRGRGGSGHVNADVVGRAALTDDEVQKIKTFVDRHAGEHKVFRHLSGRPVIEAASQMYCVYPHVCPLFEEDGRYTTNLKHR